MILFVCFCWCCLLRRLRLGIRFCSCLICVSVSLRLCFVFCVDVFRLMCICLLKM